jgi:hypothetical protein
MPIDETFEPAGNDGFFMKDVLDGALQNEINGMSSVAYAKLISYVFGVDCSPTSRNTTEFCVKNIEESERLYALIEDL